MSFPSCIKIPSKNNPAPESIDRYSTLGDSVTYEELIHIANQVFGAGRWSHAITSQTVDFVEYVMGKYHIGCAAFVRVQLADGTFHEDMGYSNTESGSKGSAVRSARSLSITEALKKALLCFGGIIEEKISKNLSLADERKEETNKRRDEQIYELPMKTHVVVQEKSSKEFKTVENIVPFVQESLPIKKPLSKPIETNSVPKCNKSPNPIESNEDIPRLNDMEVIMTEFRESDNILSDQSNLPSDKLPSMPRTEEEEIRLERKRKQKQKQEEYQKLMKEKLLKTDQKPNPRF